MSVNGSWEEERNGDFSGVEVIKKMELEMVKVIVDLKLEHNRDESEDVKEMSGVAGGTV